MPKIWEFFDDLNDIVYVSNMDTHELVYMNKKALYSFKFDSNKNIYGKKCYDVLHGCAFPCAICNNNELKVGSFNERYHYNPILKNYYVIKNTAIEENGIRYRFEMAYKIINNANHVCISNNINSHEKFVNEALRVALHAPTPDKSISIILEYIGTFIRGERAYIFEKDEKNHDSNTYEWVASGVNPEKDNLQNLPPNICATWYQSFKEDRDIIITNLEDIYDDDPDLYEVLHRQNIKSLVVLPLYDNGRVIGFCGIDNPPANSLKDTQDMLQIINHFIVATLRRRNLIRSLREISLQDQLTGLGNRHAMDEYMESLVSDKSLGIAYCDVTGLKRINDTEGHDAGDRLILRACESLKETFAEYGLFRIGGDELLVLCSGISQAEFEERITLLKQTMKTHTVNMAIGTGWTQNGAMEINDILAASEKRMYEDKSLYYRTNGIERRRR